MNESEREIAKSKLTTKSIHLLKHLTRFKVPVLKEQVFGKCIHVPKTRAIGTTTSNTKTWITRKCGTWASGFW